MKHKRPNVLFAGLGERFCLHLQKPRELVPSYNCIVQCWVTSVCNLTSHHNLYTVYILPWNLNREKVLLLKKKKIKINPGVSNSLAFCFLLSLLHSGVGWYLGFSQDFPSYSLEKKPKESHFAFGCLTLGD